MDIQVVPKKADTRLRLLLVALPVIALVAAAWWFWPRQQREIAPVLVQSGPLADSVPISATLVPVRSILISTPSGGTVAEILAYAGQPVKKGQPLLRLVNPDLERQLFEATSALAGARADYVTEQVNGRDAVSARIVDKAKAEGELKVVEMQLEAERKLQSQGIISQLTLSRTQAQRDTRIVELRYARSRAAEAAPAARAKLQAAAERVAVLQARASGLRDAVDKLTLRAPFDGVVSKADSKLGSTLAAGAQVAEIIAPNFDIAFEVSEQFANSVRVGQKLRLDKGLDGTVTSISPTADGGVVRGRASIQGDTRGLRSNSVLPGEAIVGEHGAGTFVLAPNLDVEGKSVSTRVQLPEGGIVERRIQFGNRYGQRVEIKDGAEAGESIVGLYEKDLE